VNCLSRCRFVESVELLKWGESNGCPVFHTRTFALAAGSRSGILDVIMYLHKHRCPWDGRSFRKAAAHGNLEVLKWLMSTDYIDRNMGHLGALCADAAGGGYVEVLMYLREQSCPWGERCFLEAAAGGQLETLKWLRANGCPSGDADPGFEGNTRIAGPAAQHGHLEVLTWLQENGYELDEWACAYAAKGNQLETLQWLFASGCPYNEETCGWAAIEGHVDV